MKTQPIFSYLFAFALLLGLVWSCKKVDTAVTPTPTPTPTTKSATKDITKFSFAALSPAVDATIDATAKTIKATLPVGTDITKLVPTITISDKATISPATGVAQDFTKEVSYTVTAEDASTVVYKVNVSIPAVATGTLDNILAFPNPNFDGISYLNYLNENTNVNNIKMGISNVGKAIVSKNYIFVSSEMSGLIQAYDFKNQKIKWTSTSTGNSLAIDESKGLIFQGYAGSGAGPSLSFNALDIETGNVKWTFKNPVVGTKRLYLFYPVVGNGIVTVSTSDSLYILNEDTGKVKWQFYTAINSNYDVEAPVVVNDLVIVNVYAGGKSQLTAYDLNTGKQVWNKNYSAGRMKVGDNGILVYLKSGGVTQFKFAAIDTKNGNELWTSADNSSGFEFGVGNGLVVVNSATPNYSGIVGLDIKTGAKLWQVFNDVQNITNFIITDKDIFFLRNGIIAAIDKKNQKLILDNVKNTYRPYFATSNGKAYYNQSR